MNIYRKRIADFINSGIKRSGIRQNVLCKLYNNMAPTSLKIREPDITRWKNGSVDPPSSKLEKLKDLFQSISSQENSQGNI